MWRVRVSLLGTKGTEFFGGTRVHLFVVGRLCLPHLPLEFSANVGPSFVMHRHDTYLQQDSDKLSNVTVRNIARKDFLGGLLKSYSRKAA